jgi:hypothetical protein
MAPVLLLKGGSTVAYEESAQACLNIVQPVPWVEEPEGMNEEERAYRAMDWITSNGPEGVPDAVLTLVDRFFFFRPFQDEEEAAAGDLSREPATKRLRRVPALQDLRQPRSAAH